MTEFDDLVDRDGLDEAEEARLRRVHDLLVQAGPPPELPPALLRPPTASPDPEMIEFPLHLRRRVGAWVAVAAAVAGVLFAGGYAFGHSRRSRPRSLRADPCRCTGRTRHAAPSGSETRTPSATCRCW